MSRIAIITPAGAGARNGNRHTAQRWAAMLRGAGHSVAVMLAWRGEPCDAMIALHARRSYDSVARYRAARPLEPLIVTLTGTDLYRDLPASLEARRALRLANKIVVLQEAALRELRSPLNKKARVVYQSTNCALRRTPPKDRFRIAVVGHLRAEKDPFRAPAALAFLSQSQREIEIVHVGGALDRSMEMQAKDWMRREPRYRWLGSLPHSRALSWLARSHLLVHSSVMEGGANVIAEAARLGTPVLASRISGNIGMLGKDYPGYYPLYDHAALAGLIERAMDDRDFYKTLRVSIRERSSLFAPAAERRALLGVVHEVLRLQALMSQDEIE
jgi:putative glycosyltransferase (TIGR04348 family)